MSKLSDLMYNHIYTKLPRALKSRISRAVYHPQISRKAIIAGSPEFHSHVVIGDYSTIQDDSFFAQCEIGKYCACAKGVRFLHTQHRVHAFSQMGFVGFPPYCQSPSDDPNRPGNAIVLPVAHIGNDVWLGEYSTIKCGVTVGNGAVIGARAVVTHDIPAYAIAVGVPARVIGYRFPQEKIELLEKIRWWDWSIEAIRKHYDALCALDDRLIGIAKAELQANP